MADGVHRRAAPRGGAARDRGEGPALALALHLRLLLRPQRVQLLARDDARAHELLAVELAPPSVWLLILAYMSGWV